MRLQPGRTVSGAKSTIDPSSKSGSSSVPAFEITSYWFRPSARILFSTGTGSHGASVKTTSPPASPRPYHRSGFPVPIPHHCRGAGFEGVDRYWNAPYPARPATAAAPAPTPTYLTNERRDIFRPSDTGAVLSGFSSIAPTSCQSCSQIMPTIYKRYEPPQSVQISGSFVHPTTTNVPNNRKLFNGGPRGLVRLGRHRSPSRGLRRRSPHPVPRLPFPSSSPP